MSALRVPLGACEARIPRESNLLRTRFSPAAPTRFLSLVFIFMMVVAPLRLWQSCTQGGQIADLNKCDDLQRLVEVCGQWSLFVGHMVMKLFLELV